MLKKCSVFLIMICLVLSMFSCAGNTDSSEVSSAEETSAEDSTAAVSEEITSEASEETTGAGVEKKEEKVQENIPFLTEKQYSSDLPEGSVKTKVKGVNGVKEVTYSVTYVDGKETERTVISEETLKEAVTQILICGTKKAEPTTAEKTTEQVITAEPTTEEKKTSEATTAAPDEEKTEEIVMPSRPEADLSKYAEGTVVSVQAVDDCDGSGHGYYMITLIDGTVEYQDY